MPMYDFKCPKCERKFLNVHLPITHESRDRPWCCGQVTDYHITSVPMVHWVDPVIEPFRSIATKGREVITNTRQRREYMKRNDLIDANDFTPPTPEEATKSREEVAQSIAAITPPKEVSDRMAEQGILDIVD